MPETLRIGLDIGSTTIKCVVLNEAEMCIRDSLDIDRPHLANFSADFARALIAARHIERFGEILLCAGIGQLVVCLLYTPRCV